MIGCRPQSRREEISFGRDSGEGSLAIRSEYLAKSLYPEEIARNITLTAIFAKYFRNTDIKYFLNILMSEIFRHEKDYDKISKCIYEKCFYEKYFLDIS